MKNTRSVLITGAYGGMGQATARLLAGQGYCVFALDKTIGDAQENIIPIEADVTSEESIKAAYDLVRSKTERLYGIIHFAGIYMLHSLAELETEAYDRIFDINVRGAFLINKTFLPLLEQGSRIIMTTSELAPLDPLPFTGIYAITKTALDRYAYSLRMELQLLGIKVSVLRAGAVSTGMLGASTQALERFCENTQLYSCNAERFKAIVDGVEAKNIHPRKIARKISAILEQKRPAFAYAINRNPLLLLLNALPARMQFWIIRLILKN